MLSKHSAGTVHRQVVENARIESALRSVKPEIHDKASKRMLSSIVTARTFGYTEFTGAGVAEWYTHQS